jgi:hypothetical protein
MVSPPAWALALLACASQTFAVPTGPHATPRRTPSYQSHPDRLAAVLETFDRAWTGYYTYAFPHDILDPLNNGFEDPLSVKQCLVLRTMS